MNTCGFVSILLFMKWMQNTTFCFRGLDRLGGGGDEYMQSILVLRVWMDTLGIYIQCSFEIHAVFFYFLFVCFNTK